LHKNVPNMIAQITSTLSAQGMNIENMGNRSRGDYAYTIVDVNGVPTDAVLDAIRAVDGMIRVRSIENL
ncbi:MAG: phosphoglycerate dehydrogenase, partial [Butyricicoccus pullicaecorum]